jgi:hypothetical protein
MLFVSLVTKFAAAVGILGSKWSNRHIVWIVFLTLCLPHIVAFAHPSYSQMFITIVVPVAAVAALQVDTALLRRRLPQLAITILLILVSHAAFMYHMWRTRF